ncbi:hypothetical protein AAG620_31515, partial [Pseudomonas delhiensis]
EQALPAISAQGALLHGNDVAGAQEKHPRARQSRISFLRKARRRAELAAIAPLSADICLPAFGAIHQKLGLAAGQTSTDSPEVPVLIRNDGSCGYWKAATEINDLKEASRLLGHTEEEITKKIYVRRGAMAKPVK